MDLMNQQESHKLYKHEVYKNRIVDQDGVMLPNFTLKCLEWLLNKADSIKDFSVYEYGVEASVTWWRNNSKEYNGVTNNQQAATILECKYHWDMDNYVNDIMLTKGLYDMIIINGKWRDDCILPAIQSIKPGGYIIINNYHQGGTEYRESYWNLTTPLLEKYPIVIFHDENSNTNNRTAIWQIIK